MPEVGVSQHIRRDREFERPKLLDSQIAGINQANKTTECVTDSCKEDVPDRPVPRKAPLYLHRHRAQTVTRVVHHPQNSPALRFLNPGNTPVAFLPDKTSKQSAMAQLASASDCYLQVHQEVDSSSLSGGDFHFFFSFFFMVPIFSPFLSIPPRIKKKKEKKSLQPLWIEHRTFR